VRDSARTQALNLININHGNGQVQQLIQQENIMPKGQRGNKEAKKPKKGHSATATLIPIVATPDSKDCPAMQPKKKLFWSFESWSGPTQRDPFQSSYNLTKSPAKTFETRPRFTSSNQRYRGSLQLLLASNSLLLRSIPHILFPARLGLAMK
jgi:hypothetical protein